MSQGAGANATTGSSTTLDNTLGPMLIGALFSMTLWGVTCSQTFDYFVDNTDGRLQQSIVALLWVIDTFNSAMHSHMAYYYLVTSYANTGGQKGIWSLNGHPLIAGVSNFIIRAMFARRIYQFGRRNFIVPAWIMSISIGELVVSIVMSARALHGVDSMVMQSLSKLLYIAFSLGTTADLSVTIALCWLLQSAKSGFRKSDSTVNTLMAYVVNTGLLVTVLATVGLITYVVMPDNLIFLAFFMLVGKLYLNAYLATLNARGRLRGMNSDSCAPLSGLGVASSQGKEIQGVVLTDEKRRSLRTAAMAISFQQTVERRVDHVPGGVRTPSSGCVDSPYQP